MNILVQHLIAKFSILYNNKHVSFKTGCVYISVHTVLTELTFVNKFCYLLEYDTSHYYQCT